MKGNHLPSITGITTINDHVEKITLVKIESDILFRK